MCFGLVVMTGFCVFVVGADATGDLFLCVWFVAFIVVCVCDLIWVTCDSCFRVF